MQLTKRLYYRALGMGAICLWAACGLLFAAASNACCGHDDLSDDQRAALMEAWGLSSADFDAMLKIIDEGKNRNQTMVHLTYLCEQIGPRLTASSRAERANRWVAEQFESWGLQNVHLHEWGTFPVRFDRGPSSGKMVAPEERTLTFTTRSWSAGTNGPVRGPVLREPKTEEELEAMADRLEGAWILRQIGGEQNPFLERMRNAGILGTIAGAREEIVTTGAIPGIRQLDPERLPTDVGVIVIRSDYDAINSRLADGQVVEVEFDLKHEFVAGPIPCYNTVGEIVGSELPDEIVIISAHLDSWDGPGSQGTVDNGTGSSVTIESARILAASGVKPKRTIRFILWTGEEQGLLGSRAYVESLSEEERAKISAVFVDDSGTNQQSSLSCIESMAPMLQAAVAPMNWAFPDMMEIQVNVQQRMSRAGASDHASFNAVGIPGFFWGKTGRANYRYAWHTQNDRLDQAVPEYLVKNSTVSAIVAFSLAQADTLLPRQPPLAEGEEEPEPPRRRGGRRGQGGDGDGNRQGGEEQQSGDNRGGG